MPNGQPEKLNGTGGEAHAVMAEVVALRAILLNVLFKQAKGEPLTAEEMQRLIDRADSDKLRKAREGSTTHELPKRVDDGQGFSAHL